MSNDVRGGIKLTFRRIRSEAELAEWRRLRREIFGGMESDPVDRYDSGKTRYYAVFITRDTGKTEMVGVARMVVGSVEEVPSARIVLPFGWIPASRRGLLYGEPSRFGVIRRLQGTRLAWPIILALVGGIMKDALEPDDPDEPVIDHLVHTLRQALAAVLWGVYPFHTGPDLLYYPPSAGGPGIEEPIIWATSRASEVVETFRLLLATAEFDWAFPAGPPDTVNYRVMPPEQLRRLTVRATVTMNLQLLRWDVRLDDWKQGRGELTIVTE